MDLKALAQLEPAMLRAILPGYLSGYFAVKDAADSNRARIAALVSDWNDDVCRSVVRSLVEGGDGYQVFPANDSMRALSREPGLSGTEKRDALVRALRMCAAEAELGGVIDRLIPAVVTSLVHAEKGRLRLRRRGCCC